MHFWYGSGIINTLNKLFLSGIGDVISIFVTQIWQPLQKIE